MISRVFMVSRSRRPPVRAQARRHYRSARERAREPQTQPRRRLDAGAAGDRAVREPRACGRSQRAVEKQAMLDAAAQVLAQREPCRWRRPRTMPARAMPTTGRRAGRVRRAWRRCCWTTSSATVARACVRTGSSCRKARRRCWSTWAGCRCRAIARCRRSPLPPGRIEAARPAGRRRRRPVWRWASGIAKQGEGWVLTRVDLDRDAVSRTLALSAPLAPRVLRLDPALPLGYARDLRTAAPTPCRRSATAAMPCSGSHWRSPCWSPH